MAGDWIKMRTGLLKSPQVIRLAGDLGKSKCEVLGALYTVWVIADESSLEGNIKLGPKHLDSEIGLPGFSEAMASVGWLEVLDPNSIRLTNYGEHNGKNGKRRAEDYRRAKEQREKDRIAKRERELAESSNESEEKTQEHVKSCVQKQDKVRTGGGRKVTAFDKEKEKEIEKEIEIEIEEEFPSRQTQLEEDRDFIPDEVADLEESAAVLTRKWLFMRRGPAGGNEQPVKVLESFREAIRTGMSYSSAYGDLTSRKRRRTEYLWEFMERNHPRIRPGAINTSMEATIQRMAVDPEKAKLLEVAYNGK